MRKNKKDPYIRQKFESKKDGVENKNKREPFAALYVTMLTSDAWYNLSNGSRNLYFYMKLEAQGTDPDKKKEKMDLDPEQFYFNRAIYEKYGFSNRNQVIKWRDELVSNGFIAIVENGRWTRTKNVYALSDKWKAVERKTKEPNAGTLKRKAQEAQKS